MASAPSSKEIALRFREFLLARDLFMGTFSPAPGTCGRLGRYDESALKFVSIARRHLFGKIRYFAGGNAQSRRGHPKQSKLYARFLTKNMRELKKLGEDIGVVVRYFEERDLMSCRVPAEIAQMIAAYNYRRRFPAEGPDKDVLAADVLDEHKIGVLLPRHLLPRHN